MDQNLFESLDRLLLGRLLTYEELNKVAKTHKIDLSQYLGRLDSEEAIIRTVSSLCCCRCNNQDREYFAYLPQNDSAYCLACLQMGRVAEGDRLYSLKDPSELLMEPSASFLSWDGSLSKEQSRASKDLIDSLTASHQIHMVHAVTGAGKTEMIFPVINHVLGRSGRVCIASPRIDVCLELYPRLQEAFKEVDVTLLYGGSEEVYRYSHLVIATTHQLLRFKEAFDLLIVDEVDAFPYVDDEGLHYATQRAVKAQGKLVYLTATPDKALNQGVDQGDITTTILPARYHRHPLPEPVFRWIGDWRQQINKRQKRKLYQLIQAFIKIPGVHLLFMPNIELAEQLFAWLKTDNPELGIEVVHSKDPLRKQKVQALRDGEYHTLISTTILERGVTFTNCHVCIIGSESNLYNSSALVQMSGRVGRRPDYPNGSLIYAHYGKSQSMIEARQQIQAMNKKAYEWGLIDG